MSILDEPIPYELTPQAWQGTGATMTPAEAARFLDVTHGHVCCLARKGVVSGVRVPAMDGRTSRWGWVWLLDRESVLEHRRTREEREARWAAARARPVRHCGSLPAGPLLAAVAGRGGPAAAGIRYRSTEERALLRARRDGVLTAYQADRLATLLGLHPLELWGDDWFTAR